MRIIGTKRKPWHTHHPSCSCNRCYEHKYKQGSKKSKRKPIDYFEYIRSSLWFQRRYRFLKDFGYQCKACGVTKDIQVHHKQYGNFGDEPDYALVALCSRCHKELHKRYERADIKNTELFIKAKQTLIRNIKTLDCK